MRNLSGVSLLLAFMYVAGWIGQPSLAADPPAGGAAGAAAIEGTVTDAAGRPVAGAAVVLVTDATLPVSLSGGAFHAEDAETAVTATTDAQGRFTLRGIDEALLRDEGYLVAAAHAEAGFAEAAGDPAKPKRVDVRLAPWARFAGTVKLGGKPAAGRRIRLVQSPLTGPQLWVEEEATVDGDGRVVLDRCRPGLMVVEYREGDAWRRVDVAVLRRGEAARWAGELQRRAVRGRFVLPEGAARAIKAQAYLRGVPDRPKPRLPDEAIGLFGDERKQWMAKWVQTDAGRDYEMERLRYENQEAGIHMKVDLEGNLTAEDVPAGTYHVWANAGLVKAGAAVAAAPERPKFKAPPYTSHEADADADKETPAEDVAVALTVHVEAVPGGAEAPFVLPDVKLEPSKVQPVEDGEPVPDLVLRRLVDPAAPAAPVAGAAADDNAGKPVRVSDYRGKYLLLDCWATWCGPCLAATPALKALHADHAAAGRLVIVGVSFDEDADPAARYVRKASLPWTQCIVDHADPGDQGSQIPQLFGPGLPNFVLIDPEGNLASRGHDINAVKAILDAAAKEGAAPGRAK